MGVGPTVYGSIEAGAVAALAIPFGLWALWLVWFALRPLKESELKLWATAYSLTLTAAILPLVVRYLQRAQRWRRLGFTFGLVVAGPLISLLRHEGPTASMVLAILTYSAGIVAAQVFRRRLPATGAADLEPRTLARYLPQRLLVIPRVLLVVVAAASAWSLTVGDPVGGSWTLDRREVAAYLAVGVALQLVGEVTLRAVVQRRQPAAGRDVLAADDAMRTCSVHAVAGGLIGIHGSLLLPGLARPAQANLLNPLFDTLMLLGPIAGWLVGTWYQGRAWRVRRAVPAPPAAPPPPVEAPA